MWFARVLLVAVYLAVCAGCGGDEDDGNVCIFDGRYDSGFLPITAGCPSFSFAAPIYDDEEECIQSGSDITPTGVTFDLFLSCVPGNPVVECEGIANLSNGCSYNAYLRRLAP
jgi:hypothetical protein